MQRMKVLFCCYYNAMQHPQSHVFIHFENLIKVSHLVACLVVGVCGRQEGAVETLQEVRYPLVQGSSQIARSPKKLDAPLPRQHHKRQGIQLGIRCRDLGRSGFPRPPSGGRGQGPCSYRSQTAGHPRLGLLDVAPFAARYGRLTRFLSIGGAGVGRCPQDVEGGSCPAQGVVGPPGDSPVCPPLDIPLWPASRVSVRDRGTQLTLSGTTACVNGHELKDSKFLFRGGRVVAWDKWSCPAAAGRQ